MSTSPARHNSLDLGQPDRARPDVVMLSTADWDHPCWTNKQHVALGLAKRGHRVLYIDSLGLRQPTTGSRDLARMARRIKQGVLPQRQVHERIWVLSPLVVPGATGSIGKRLNQRLLTGAVRRSIRRLDISRPILWTYNPHALELLEGLQRSLLVYHCVDELAAAPGIDHQSIRAAESRLVQQADLVFTTSPALQASRGPLNPTHTYYLPNVADYDHFSQACVPGNLPADLACIPRPRIGFIGAISQYKLDFSLIQQIARRHPQWQWVMIGQAGEGEPGVSLAQLSAPNVHLLGPRPYAQLPDYLRGMDVAVLPAPQNEYTRHMFPMKFFEYLAAGKPVVSTPLPALAEFDSACQFAAGVDQFSAAITNTLAGQGPPLATRLELARRHTWENRLDAMEEILHRRLRTLSSPQTAAA